MSTYFQVAVPKVCTHKSEQHDAWSLDGEWPDSRHAFLALRWAALLDVLVGLEYDRKRSPHPAVWQHVRRAGMRHSVGPKPALPVQQDMPTVQELLQRLQDQVQRNPPLRTRQG